ncbi:membrane protein [Spirochaetia bacterium]|nr:membrane protein [Spirochaetia bacterium]
MQKAMVWFCLSILLFPISAEQFSYKYRDGDMYRILSKVHTDVYINRRFNQHTETLNRIAATVTGVENGSGLHEMTTQTSVQGDHTGAAFQLDQEYQTIFKRDALGYYSISGQYFTPQVRDAPVFPDRDLKPGETWTSDGHEVHDFRKTFGIPEPYRIPFTAHYTFLGNREWKGQSYPAFSVAYRVFSEPAPIPGSVYPVRLMEASDETIFWDMQLGQPVAYSEQFRVVFELSDGSTIEYRGSADAEVIESEIMDKDTMIEDINQELERLGFDGTNIRVGDEGITIIMDNIQFRPDSPVMLPGEDEKLKKISEILSKYPDRDILVSGHTALAGTARAQQQLSEERAGVVATYFIQNNIREPSHIMTRGYGATQPLADNTTEDGRRRNRRVEITIRQN